ncbi:MAG: UDP-2,3-diacylglucosamine diphosphatase [Gammaproteobacteria bacterium]|nr:UDP-2,3-diacylglucosamine diphosphatase [Gammaproteobacteria bacterium]MYK82550.1 UDP-2,3-diacylglucosamine diphosphatase [Gammaproteobacteria bacterium]
MTDDRAQPKRIFLSDLHLDSTQDQRFARFVECLETEAAWAEEVFILGDLFEAWIGDDDDSALAKRVCAVLERAAQRTAVGVMAGNRDFLIGQQFAERTGAQLLPDPFRTHDRLILAHGDALCTGDEAYQAMRKLFRSPVWQAEMLAKPLIERRTAANGLRSASRASNAVKPMAIMDADPAAADRLFEDLGGQVLIHGHTHRPAIHGHAQGLRYVLGDWARCGWLLRQTGQRFRLECFALDQPYRCPIP